MRQLVVGAGEVGSAIAAVLTGAYEVSIRDMVGETPRADVLHVCFPWSDDFERAVRLYQTASGTDLIIIHSTVPVGTSRRVGAIHSPVTGRHPDLVPSLRTFTKWFGGGQAAQAAAVFAACGVSTETVPDPETTEAGKLWQTLQYGWLIALQKEAYRYCFLEGADPEVAYGRMNETYNAGYAALGEPFRLPVLADMPGPIGGHCVIPNAVMTASRLGEMLLELDAGWALDAAQEDVA